jgi:predicted RecB family nuclease
MKITDHVAEAYLSCKYKAYLLLKGETGTPHDYEVLMDGLRAEYKPKAIEVLLRRCNLESAPSIPIVKVDDLKELHPLILDCTVENDQFQFRVDALKKVDGKSSLGSSHYIPILFHHENDVCEQRKKLLAFSSLVLEQFQNRSPETGTLIFGREYHLSNIQVGKRREKLGGLLTDLHQISVGVITPNVRLNKHCDVCEFRFRCETEVKEKDDLSLLRGMSDLEIDKQNNKGIFTVHQLSYTFRARKQPKRAKSRENPHYHALKALAIREQKLYVYGTPEWPMANDGVYVDMEGDESGHFVYLIGALVRHGEKKTHHSFWADNKSQEARIFEEFFTMLGSLNEPRLYHFGSYETRVFRRILSSMPQSSAQPILERTTNVLGTIYSHLYFPTYSNSLKDIGACLGCTWTGQDPSGLQSIVWRKQWEQDGRDSLKQALLRYNYEDCLAVQSVADCIAAVVLQTGGTSQSGLLRNLETVDSGGYAADLGRFGRKQSAFEGFDSLVENAYFDYQRHRIYVRTNPNFKKINRAARRQRKANKPTKSVEFRANKCTHCKSHNVSRNRSVYRSKLGIDLKVMQTGIRRQITKFCHAEHQCRDCGRTFTPPTYKRQERDGHSLLAWCIYQHVANRTTFEQLETTLADCFGVSLPLGRIYDFKSSAARYYAKTYDRLFRKIVSGRLIHADETQINLLHEKGYVWVFANLEEVVYMYRPTRKADFLSPLLEDFGGVLVTDFYTGYDGLRCRQQKCLVHLIRDLNESLLKHPYDEELRKLSSGFADLLSEILKTVDRFGLRRNHLRRHERSVQKYFGKIQETDYRSRVAISLQKRILKTQNKLFEFLRHDGVPWNNNNAEHAIKHFAKYRRMVKGRISEKGLSDYLVLLSLFETCRYKGISYLDFLLSQERDIDRYCERVW